MSLVVGLDLSLSATGVALASGDLRTITSKPDDGTVKGRADRIIDLANRIASCVWSDTDLVVVEAPAVGYGRQGGEHLRAGLWWQVATNLVLSGLDVVDVPPASLKKFATGKGTATKPDMRMALYQRAGIDERDDNRVDAYFLRQAGLHLLGDPDALDLPKTHLAALAKVRRPIFDTEVPF